MPITRRHFGWCALNQPHSGDLAFPLAVRQSKLSTGWGYVVETTAPTPMCCLSLASLVNVNVWIGRLATFIKAVDVLPWRELEVGWKVPSQIVSALLSLCDPYCCPPCHDSAACVCVCVWLLIRGNTLKNRPYTHWKVHKGVGGRTPHEAATCKIQVTEYQEPR
ncbi:hypothetical protein ElyMa_005285200 [Elysia marginata]|uniref:Uncharacterized protein n=1 Tax=Elysia marginata TaxID=1093978 RepID=A0AAV4K334_9GAST|nr:hypothetical protein ElyMa_005285200 [Elysia marginata]